MVKLSRPVQENLHLFLVEIAQQFKLVELFFRYPDQRVLVRLESRKGYAENLRSRIQKSIILSTGVNRNAESPRLPDRAEKLKALEQLTNELSSMMEQGIQAVTEAEGLTEAATRIFPAKDCAKLIKQIRRVTALIEEVLETRDAQVAINLGKNCRELKKRLHKITEKYVHESTQVSVAEQTVFHYALFAVRQMIQHQQKISELLLTILLGQKMTSRRYSSISEVARNFQTEVGDIEIETVAETRSGSAIGGVRTKGSDSAEYLAIFKEGDKKKLKEERQGVESWHEKFPGLAPQILGYEKKGDSASLLIEHLPGHTFESLLSFDREDVLEAALSKILKTLKLIWQATEVDEPVCAEFVSQLKGRLDTVYRVHPGFKTLPASLCDSRVPSYDELLDEAIALEKSWPAPFSVYIHGDFNVDNIIYEPLEKRVNFIDLHRSRQTDYIQDISVFMVSIYRLQTADDAVRLKMMGVIKSFYSSVRRYAKRRGDDTFDVRLAFGLARSFATSTRFIIDPKLSKKMYLRSRYLLEKMIKIDPGKASKYRIPVEELFYE